MDMRTDAMKPLLTCRACYLELFVYLRLIIVILSLCTSAHLTVLSLSNPALNLTFSLLPITSSHPHASASDYSTFDFWWYRNIWLALTLCCREELEKQQAKERYEKLHLAGKTDEARADLARLALIKKQREDAAKKREDERKGTHAVHVHLFVVKKQIF